MAVGARSVTVRLRSGVSDATLPDNRKMVSGRGYAISMDDFAKLSRSVRDTVIDEPTINTTDYVVPLWNNADYALNLTTIHDKASVALVNADAQAAKDFVLGEVVQGFNGSAFKLVKLVGGVATTTTKNVCTWADKAANTVTVDISDGFTEFAGVAIAALTDAQFGWIQIEGTISAAAADSGVTAGDSVAVHATTDGVFASGLNDEVQVITMTSFDGTDAFRLTYGGVESAGAPGLVTRGTNATAAGVQAVAETIAALTGNVTVSGTTDTGPYTFTFTGSLSGTDVGNITVTSGTGSATGATVVSVAGGGSAAGASVGTALTTSSATLSDVQLRNGLAMPRHRHTMKLFLDK